MKRPAIFLDRDGVINRPVIKDGKPYPPRSLEALEILPGVERALTDLSAAGYCLVVVTNQPDVARGVLSRDIVHGIHGRLKAKLPLDAVFTCFHDDADQCECRKPKPGLLLRAAHEWNVSMSESYMVGDRWRDIEAGQQAGCKTCFIDYNYDEKRPDSCDMYAGSLLTVAQTILRQRLR